MDGTQLADTLDRMADTIKDSGQQWTEWIEQAAADVEAALASRDPRLRVGKPGEGVPIASDPDEPGIPEKERKRRFWLRKMREQAIAEDATGRVGVIRLRCESRADMELARIIDLTHDAIRLRDSDRLGRSAGRWRRLAGLAEPTPRNDGEAAMADAGGNGADAIDESDVAILAFLNRTPNLRRKVSDVLPDYGPQDRKAVGKRLRKLADRTPPLVDYPKGGRGRVAILPAGIDALKRTTAPTPR